MTLNIIGGYLKLHVHCTVPLRSYTLSILKGFAQSFIFAIPINPSVFRSKLRRSLKAHAHFLSL